MRDVRRGSILLADQIALKDQARPSDKNAGILLNMNTTQRTLVKFLGIEPTVFENEDLLEEHLVRRAIRDLTLPKFEIVECSIFEDILNDVFLPDLSQEEKKQYKQSEVM